MSRYYQPTKEELVGGLELEMYYGTDNTWTPFVYNTSDHSKIDIEDLRVKYLDSEDFNKLRYDVIKKKLGTEEVIIGYDDDDKEITEEHDIYDEEVLTINRSGLEIGKFLPYAPNAEVDYNVILDHKEYTIKNLTELRKILK